jgi:hypothetical protein
MWCYYLGLRSSITPDEAGEHFAISNSFITDLVHLRKYSNYEAQEIMPSNSKREWIFSFGFAFEKDILGEPSSAG